MCWKHPETLNRLVIAQLMATTVYIILSVLQMSICSICAVVSAMISSILLALCGAVQHSGMTQIERELFPTHSPYHVISTPRNFLTFS